MFSMKDSIYFANKDEIKSLEVGSTEEKEEGEKLKKTFDYEEDIEDLANLVDKKQRELLTERELNAAFAAKFVLDGINVELEHGTINPNTNVTNDDLIMTAKIALAHLNEFPNYYNKEYGIKTFEKFLQNKAL